MSRVALLLGVSRYPPGLNLLPKVPKDLEAMRRALKQPKPGFDPVEVYPDPPQQKMLEAIESFFQNRNPDDQIVFLFCGYLIQDSDQSLYFATPETQADSQGRLIKARAIPARFVQDVMNSSPAKQQIMILDCYIRQNFTGQSTAEESPINLQTCLGGESRVILASSARTRHYNEPEELDVWSYARYLADGVETAAADDNSNGFITVDEWHNYARRKLGTAAPAMQPELFGSMETARQFFLPVSVDSPPVAYRKMLEEMVGRGEVDVTGSTILTQRTLLDDIRYNLELSPQEAAAIEAQALRPVQDYRQRLQTYQEKSSGITQKEGVANPQIRQYLNQIQSILGLTDTDTAAIDAAPRMAEQQKQRDQYQDRLAKYQQVLLITMQRQFPLAEGDRQVLQRLQQVLQIRDEDAAAAETQLIEQINSQSAFVPQDATPIGQTAASVPPAQTTMPANAGVVEGAFPRTGFTNFASTPASGAPQSDRIRNVSFNPAETPPPQEVLGVPNEPQQHVDSSGVAQDTPVPPSPQAPMSSTPRGPTEARVTETRVSRSYSALIIPGILLAALIGSLVALWSSKNLPNPFGGQNAPTTSTGTNAPSAAKSAAANIGYGIEAYGAGLTDKAISYATDAINSLSKDCPSGGQGNSQSNSCLYLARAYNNRSNAHFAQQNYGRALSDANQALALDPNLAEARINLANAKFRQGDLSGAQAEYNKVLNQKEVNSTIKAGVYNNLGSIQLAQKNFNEAINQFNQAIKLKPNYSDAFYNRAIAQEALGQTAKAINDYRSAAQYYRNQGVASLNQAEQAEKRAAALQQKSPAPSPSKAPQSSPASAPQSVPASTDATPKG